METKTNHPKKTLNYTSIDQIRSELFNCILTGEFTSQGLEHYHLGSDFTSEIIQHKKIIYPIIRNGLRENPNWEFIVPIDLIQEVQIEKGNLGGVCIKLNLEKDNREKKSISLYFSITRIESNGWLFIKWWNDFQYGKNRQLEKHLFKKRPRENCSYINSKIQKKNSQIERIPRKFIYSGKMKLSNSLTELVKKLALPTEQIFLRQQHAFDFF